MTDDAQRDWLIGGLAFAAAGAAFAGLGLVAGPAALYLLFPPAVLFAYAGRESASPRARAALTGVVFAAAAIFVARGLNVVRMNIHDIEEWDFQAFWVWGRAVAMGLNPYLPESIAQASAASGMEPSKLFADQVLGAGFPYPPSTMLMLRPFGGLDPGTGIVLWYLFHGAALGLCLWLLWKLILPQSGLTGLALATALLVGFRSTQTTLHLGQTHFVILAALLLYWRQRESAWGGWWLAVGAGTKPWVAMVLLLPLVRRRWRVIAGAVGGTLALFGAAALWFGPGMVMSYLSLGAVARMPTRYFSSVVNQSLLATILRLSVEKESIHLDPRQSPMALLLYVTIAGLLTLTTAWLIHRLGPRRDDLAFCLTLTLALLLYPGTLYHYAMMLLTPLFWMWARRDELRLPTPLATAIVTIPFVLVGSSHAQYNFVAIAFSWLAFAVIAWRAVRFSGGAPA
ncbi:MAG TPA: glycosyltransferase family 87 protein, partial [Candidatus Polarisedimenticolia bacterium]|nr:glycosyltransferase family 87 protein [Candidatus Polarisedimenticolia bacterium]